jgi:hypothetical protein
VGLPLLPLRHRDGGPGFRRDGALDGDAAGGAGARWSPFYNAVILALVVNAVLTCAG